MNKKQKEVFEKIKRKLNENNIELLTEEYKNLNEKLLLRDKNNNEWKLTGRAILNGNFFLKSDIETFRKNNAKSIKNRKLTPLSTIIELLKEKNSNIEYISGYKNKETNALFLCKICNNKFETKPKYLLSGHSCPICARNKVNNGLHSAKTSAEFKKEISDLTNGEYEVISDYKNQYEKVLIKHLKCGKEYFITPKYFLRGDRCRSCMEKKVKKTEEKFVKYLNLEEPFYEIRSEFLGRKKPITLYNSKLDDEYITTPDKFIAGVRSPLDSHYKGEILIKTILNKLKVKYTFHYKEKKLKDKKELEFDFKLSNTNIFIEFNGIQHYEPVELFGGEKYLEYTQRHDKMKLDFCNKYNFPFLIIDYKTKDEDFKILIKNFLDKNHIEYDVDAYKSL